jgi:hypothetical protein
MIVSYRLAISIHAARRNNLWPLHRELRRSGHVPPLKCYRAMTPPRNVTPFGGPHVVRHPLSRNPGAGVISTPSRVQAAIVRLMGRVDWSSLPSDQDSRSRAASIAPMRCMLLPHRSAISVHEQHRRLRSATKSRSLRIKTVGRVGRP